jgi:TonB-linked SusC/RagA family outer membrane protein
MKIIISIFTITISLLIYETTSAQADLSLTGVVISEEDGKPVSYVTVNIKGTNRHTLTDDSGKFVIPGTIGDTIFISSLGYNPVYVAADNHNLNLKIKPSSFMLNELKVVATALGIKRAPKELGSSTEVIRHDELSQGSPLNALTGLTGKVAGLRVNMYDSKVDPGFQITMRGSRSITGNNAPLYVVDGVPVPEINRINPGDIESITILKGANAAALYGSEGVNGALIIVTKSGEGSNGRVSFRQSTSLSHVYLLPQAQREFGQGIDGVYSPVEYHSWGAAYDGKPGNSARDRDVRKELFKTGMNIQNDLSFSRERGDDRYYFSLQNVTVKGIIPKDRSSRNGARLNTVQNIGKLRISSALSYNHVNTNTTPDGPWVSMYRMPADFPLEKMVNWRDPNSPGNPDNFFTTVVKNPYFLIDTYRNESIQQVVNGKVEAEYPIASWLKAMYRLGLYSNWVQTRSTVEKFESERAGASQQGSVKDGTSNFRRLNGDFILSAEKEFGKFKLNAIAGHNFREEMTKTTDVAASNLLFPDLFNQGSRSGNLTGGSAILNERQYSIYAEVTAGYSGYLFLTLTGRRDNTSLLHPDNSSYFYPGVSASFILTDAFPSIREKTVTDYLKLYTSYNKTGNVNLSPYSLNLTYSQAGGFPYGDLTGFIPSSKNPNSDIRPEFVRSFEAGLQWSLLKRRVNAEIAYVYSNSEGQIFAATSSAATGYTTSMVNLGELENNIIELSLDGDIVRKRDFRINAAFSYTYINNVVKDLYGSGEAEEYNIFRQSYAIKGMPYPSLKVTDYKRDDRGRVIVDAITGLPSASTDPTYKGTMVPPHQFGFQTTIKYKGLSVYADFDSRLGGWMYSEVANAMIQTGTHPMTTQYGRKEFVIPNSVIGISNPDGSVTYQPNTSVVAKGSGNSAYWNKYVAGYSVNYAAPGDYFKMRTLSVKYTIPKSTIAKLKIFKEVTIGAEATNLFIIRHKDNDFGDPEYLYNNTAGYYSWRQVPPYRTVGFTANIVF